MTDRNLKLAAGAFALTFFWFAAGPVFVTTFQNARASISNAIAEGEDYAASIQRYRALLAEIAQFDERGRETARARALSQL